MPIPGCLGPFWYPRTHPTFGGPRSLLGFQDPSWSARVFWGGRFPHGVPGPISGCQGLFWGSRIPSGVAELVPGYLGQFGDTNTHPGPSELILGCLGLFWGARTPFGTSESILGCLSSFLGSSRGTRVCFGVPVSLQGDFMGSFSLGVPPHPKTPHCTPPSNFGAGVRGFGGPGPPSCFGGVGGVPWAVWAGGGGDLGARGMFWGAQSRFGGFGAVLGALEEPPWRVLMGERGSPPLIINPSGPGREGGEVWGWQQIWGSLHGLRG